MMIAKTHASREDTIAPVSFTRRHGVFLTETTHVDFVKSHGSDIADHACFLALSAKSYGAAISSGLRHVISFETLSDFEGWTRASANIFTLATTWLSELGLKFEFSGIDFAEFDVIYQNEFFAHATYIALAAERAMILHPEIDVFYVFHRRAWLPQDAYFDSDVAAAVILFVGERLGRRVRPLESAIDSLLYPFWSERPMVSAPRPWHTPSISVEPAFPEPRICFAPATVKHRAQIFSALRKSQEALIVVPATWDFALSDIKDGDLVAPLSSEPGGWSPDVDATLQTLLPLFKERAKFSSLPDFIGQNRHLDFQFSYIFARRWSAYANIVARARQLVSSQPIVLFVMADVWSAESCAVAAMCRKAGTNVLIFPPFGLARR